MRSDSGFFITFHLIYLSQSFQISDLGTTMAQ